MLPRLTLAVALALLAAAPRARGAEAARPDLPALAPVPAEAVGFVHVPSIRSFEADLQRFAERTGWTIGEGEHPVLGALALRTDLAAGLDAERGFTIAWLDSKRYRDRYTLYVLPLADWDAVLTAGAAEEVGTGIFALTGTRGPRYVLKCDDHVLVTSSVRTMDAVTRSKAKLVEVLPPATLRRIAAARGPYVRADVGALTNIYAGEIASWFRAASGQVYLQPDVMPYAEIFVTYMLGIADVLDQVETVEAEVAFGAEGVAVHLAVDVVRDDWLGAFLARQEKGAAPIAPLGDGPITRVTTLRLDPDTAADTAAKVTRFFLEKAPRPEPLPEPLKREIREAVAALTDSLGDHLSMLSAPAGPGQGLSAEVSVYAVRDPEGFRKAVQMLAAAWEQLADQVDFYLRFKVVPDADSVDGVPVTFYVPQMRYGITARHLLFMEQLRSLYGPEGLVYRLAVVKDHAVVGVGSDTRLFRQTVKGLKAGQMDEPSPAMRRLEPHLPEARHMSVVTSLPLYVRQALIRGGTKPEVIGSVDPGNERAGVGVEMTAEGLRIGSWWPHEQIRLARELIDRVAPGLAESPESLFVPPEEGPPPVMPEQTPEPLPVPQAP